MRKSSATDKTIGKYGRTITGDQFIGELFNHGRVLIPQSMDRWGNIGPLFNHFLVGSRDDAPDPMTYDISTHSNAKKMNEIAVSTKVPHGILNTANKCWMESHPDSCYGDSYLDANPKSWAWQQLGLGFTKALVCHLHEMNNRANDPTAKSIYERRRVSKVREKAIAAADVPQVDASPNDDDCPDPKRSSVLTPPTPSTSTFTTTTINNNNGNDGASQSPLGDSLPLSIVMDPVKGKEHDVDAIMDLTNDSEGPHDSHIPSMFTYLGLPAPS